MLRMVQLGSVAASGAAADDTLALPDNLGFRLPGVTASGSQLLCMTD